MAAGVDAAGLSRQGALGPVHWINVASNYNWTSQSSKPGASLWRRSVLVPY